MYTMHVKSVHNNGRYYDNPSEKIEWHGEVPKDNEDAIDMAEHIVKYFNTSLRENEIPDPVVLQEVRGGYLIITAWGDEASDPLIVNKNNN